MSESRLPLLDSKKYLNLVTEHRGGRLIGKICQVIGLVVEASGIRPFIGEICRIETAPGRSVPAEVVGFRADRCLLMPYGELKGVSPGCRVFPTGKSFTVRVGESLLGRVLDGLGRDLATGKAPLASGEGEECAVHRSPPNPMERAPINDILLTGIKAIDSLLTCGRGQRLGIFAGSGVGKSTLLGMIARHGQADVNVIALIGERGREVGDFIRRDLGPGGLNRSVVVAATSDRPPLERVTAGLVAKTIAEYFRDQGIHVTFMMDSVTRFCMAQREIGLAVGEPPSARGYTPSVFAQLGRFLERSGTARRGSITGFYSVLVDGDDFNEPITDAARSILDGHIILSREIASQNRYPAIDILRSNSRLMPHLIGREQAAAADEIRELLATYESMEDLINIGAYTAGSQKNIDRAMEKRDQILGFLQQERDHQYSWAETLSLMKKIIE
ncbi:MAG TPA: FliI/YscN family ATPase [Firmicutes bacterium]|nr:FliI/YscN family ATPase [Bacillota bacterium]